MNSLEKFNRHINKPIKVRLKNADGEDEFEFKPINFEQFGQILFIAGKSKGQEFDISKLDKEDIDLFLNLFFDIVKNSYPDLENEVIKNFVISNLASLNDILEKLMPTFEDKRTVLIKERIAAMKRNEPTGTNKE
ncbi:MAG: hypothetical protein AABY22_02365 [Nanoarchaeota archaeon]